MAIPVIASTNAAGYETNAGTSVTVTAPSGIADGNLLLAHIVTDGSKTPALSGWSDITGSPLSEGSATSSVLWKIAASESGNYTFAWSGSESAAGRMWRITGATATPIGAISTNTGSNSTTTATGITTQQDDSLVFAFHGNDRDRGTPALQTGGWSDSASASDGGANGKGYSTATQGFATGGTSTGDVTWTISTGDGFNCLQLEIRSIDPTGIGSVFGGSDVIFGGLVIH